MGVPTWACTVCEKKFKAGDWICTDGVSNHAVTVKEYLLDDAPQDTGRPERGGMDSLRDGRTRICNIPPDKKAMENGEVRIIPGGYVEFIRGRFSTSDPEIQYHLEKKGGFCTEERWRAVWLSDGQQLELQRMQINADRQRLENDRNELLNSVKNRAQQKQESHQETP